MNIKNLFLCAAIAILGCGNAYAQTDFFWSLNDLNGGATNTDLVTEFEPGESGTLFLYYSTNGPADSDIDTGAFLDIATSQDGVIQFASAQTLDFNISFFGSPLAVRWGDSVGSTATVNDDEIDELSAFTFFSGEGILESNNGSAGLVDEGYDAGADAFLFAEVDFTVLPSAAAGTIVELVTTAGSGNIVNQGLPVPATFGSASIMIVQGIVLGDFNGDGDVTMMDVNPFVQAIIAGTFSEVADLNLDGFVNLLDVRPFVDALTN